jgi:biotin/methionine sulfoxide reductase
MGEADGVPKNPEWAAAICEIDAESIRLLARRMAKGRTMIGLAYSLQRADHGEQPMWAGIALAAMLGQIGLPGGGFGIGYGSMGTKGGRRAPAPLRAVPTGNNPTGRYIPVARVSDMLLSPGETIDFDGKRITYPDIRMMMWGGGNPFHHHQDINKLVTAWRKPETIVILEPFWTPAARHADIVLPVASTLERNDISAGWFDRTVYAMRQAIEPIGEARSNFDIVGALAQRLGCYEAFSENRDEMGWVRHLYETFAAEVRAAGGELPSFDAFWLSGEVTLPPESEPHVMFADFRRDPTAHRLDTPSGKIEMFSAVVDSFGYADCAGHPKWIEPVEWLGSDKASRYPLHLISNQPANRLHGQNDPSPHSLAAKTAGRETLLMHPADASERGLASGTVVRVFNERGACLAGLRLSERLRRGVVQLPTGAWYDPVEPGRAEALDRHGNPNVLTIDKGTSSLAQAPIAHSALVDVERWSGADMPVRAFEAPAFVDRDSSVGISR